MARSRTISDDWLDVDEDNLSVISLPNSNDGAHEDSDNRRGDPSDAPVQLPTRDIVETGVLDYTTAAAVAQAARFPDTDTGSSEHPDLRSRQDALAQDINPTAMLDYATRLKRVCGQVADILQRAASAPYSTNVDVTINTVLVFDSLASQLDPLEVILQGYQRAWGVMNGNIPLDPGLLSWLEQGLEAANAVHHRLSRARQGADPLRDCRTFETVRDLEELSEQMESFLPILQAVFNEFQCERLPTGMAALRSELYILKDRINLVMGYLNSCSEAFQKSARDGQDGVIRVLGQVFETVTLMVTNHPSDWIESGLRGGPTHAEFANLDADLISTLSAEMQSVLMGLDVNHGSAWQEPTALNDHMQAEHTRSALMDEGYLDKIETLAQVLEGIFRSNESR